MKPDEVVVDITEPVEPAETPRRIYLVNIVGVSGPNRNRLVRTTSAAKAVKHVTQELVACRVATTDDVAELVSEGMKVENA